MRKKSPAPFCLRLSEEERAQLEKEAGEKPLGVYIRSRLFDKETPRRFPRKKRPLKDTKLLAQLLGQLGQSRIANNLNQIAYQANIDALLLTPEVEAQIKEAYQEIQVMRKLLMQALGFKE